MKKIGGWKIIFKYLLNYRREIIALSVLGLISALANGTVPFLVGRFLDSILSDNDLSFFSYMVPLWLFLLAIWFLVQFIASYADWRLGLGRHIFANKIFYSYLVESSARLIRMPLSFHKDTKTGESTSKIREAGIWLSQIIDSVIINLGPQFLGIVVGFGFILYIQPIATLPLAFGILLYIYFIARVNSSAGALQKQVWKENSKGYGIQHEIFTNIDAVKKFTAEKFSMWRLSKQFLDKVSGIMFRRDKLWSKISFSQSLIVIGAQLSVFIISIIYIQKGDMTLGDLIALNGYASMFFGPFATLGYNWQSMQNGIVGLQDAEKILHLPQEQYKPKDGIKASSIDGNIKFDNVNFSYKNGEKTLLKNINFKISKGEVVALVGQSGVGKSTLVDLVGGFYFPVKGEVLIDGNSTKKLDLEFLRSQIAYVPQEVLLFNDTIMQNLKFANPIASKKEIINAAEEAKAHEFIEKFPKKYQSKVGERGVKLSVGQKQRIAIARAILRDPKILILDEPTSALDAKTEYQLTQSLEKLMQGRTTIIIAHRLSTVRRANKIIVLKEGEVVETGSHEELIKIPDGVYKELYELQKID
ncbi:MAG: ABC transporter ATP-binding protein [Candidatus Spechtbacterales bacterium]